MFCAAGSPKLVPPCLDAPSALQLCFLRAQGMLHACSGAGAKSGRTDNLCKQPGSSARCTPGPVRSDLSAPPPVHGVSLYAEEGAAYQLIYLSKRYCLQLLLVLSSKLSSVERMSPQQLICYLHASPTLELLILHAQEKGPMCSRRGQHGKSESLARSGNLELAAALLAH